MLLAVIQLGNSQIFTRVDEVEVERKQESWHAQGRETDHMWHTLPWKPSLITPHLILLSLLLPRLLAEKRQELLDQANKLRTGLFKIDETREKVETMSLELEEAKRKVAEFQKQCEEYLVIIVQQKREADEQQKASPQHTRSPKSLGLPSKPPFTVPRYAERP